MTHFKIIFDDIILAQLKKTGKNKQIKDILSNIFDKIEEMGPRAGKLIDSKLFIYEIKHKRPPIRLYFKHIKGSNTIYLFEYELKKGKEKQRKIINKIKEKVKRLFKLKT